jgi:hypothetical protein
LRQSGDDLTRMVRGYVATGDPVFRQRSGHVDIRAGKLRGVSETRARCR